MQLNSTADLFMDVKSVSVAGEATEFPGRLNSRISRWDGKNAMFFSLQRVKDMVTEGVCVPTSKTRPMDRVPSTIYPFETSSALHGLMLMISLTNVLFHFSLGSFRSSVQLGSLPHRHAVLRITDVSSCTHVNDDIKILVLHLLQRRLLPGLASAWLFANPVFGSAALPALHASDPTQKRAMLFLCCTEFLKQEAAFVLVDILHLAERIAHPFANDDIRVNFDQVSTSLLPPTLREQIKTCFECGGV